MHPKRFVELGPDELCRAVEAQHQCTAHFEFWQHVEQPYGTVWWMGGVGIFRLAGHPVATRCFAWSWPVNGSESREVHAVLQLAEVQGPADAVRAVLDQSSLPPECPP